MDSYWRNREQANLRAYIKDEKAFAREISDIYDYMMDEINKEINGFYSRYARKEGISMALARERVSETDIRRYQRKAQKYVKNRTFTAQANEEMRIYNLTMRVNRLEMLKANIGLEMVDSFQDLQDYFDQILTDRTLAEFERQAGILGKTVKNPKTAAKTIVGASFHNATFSDRIWMYQGMLKSELDRLLQEGMIQGTGPRELARHLKRYFGVGQRDAERLMRTELARVQVEAEAESLKEYGFEYYQFNALGTACPECLALDGKHFKIADRMPGENCPPIHPNCRCSISGWMDDKEYNEWLNTYKKHGLSFEEWKRDRG